MRAKATFKASLEQSGRKRLGDIEEGLGELEGAVEEFQDYSYSFNIKMSLSLVIERRQRIQATFVLTYSIRWALKFQYAILI